MTTSLRIHQINQFGRLASLCLIPLGLAALTGCQSGSSSGVRMTQEVPIERPEVSESMQQARVVDMDSVDMDSIVQTAFIVDEKTQGKTEAKPVETTEANKNAANTELIPPGLDSTINELPMLESIAQAANPKLRRLEQEANAASAKSRYVDKLPDPTFGANIFGNPIETAAGSQRANLSLGQKIPWLERLDAQQQQAIFVAMSLRQKFAAERLRVVGDVRAQYFRLYVLAKQIESVEANQELLEPLIEILNSRIPFGKATQGDVLLGTLELSRLEEQLITLRQLEISTLSELNRLLNRPVSTPVKVPTQLEAITPQWSHEMLVQTAFERQPVIAAAQLQANASRWGVNVAELSRRPDIQLGAAWFFMDNNRPPSNVVNVGRDAWSLGATISIPLDREKYDAIQDEALWKHAATQANVEDVQREFDSRLLSLLEQAKAASETASLYQDTIVPQSQQTLNADLESLTDGAVEFDRVIQDFRNLLTLEFGYHRSVGQLATSIARIRQAVGLDIQPQEELPTLIPVPPMDNPADEADPAGN